MVKINPSFIKAHCIAFGVPDSQNNTWVDDRQYAKNDACQITSHTLVSYQHSHITIACLIHHNNARQFFISFFIQGTDVSPFTLPAFNTVKQADFLWQTTCFECFFGQGQINDKHKNNGYIEINASPTGAYACYTFDGYRSPNTLPPVKANSTQVRLTWSDSIHQSPLARHFSVTLSQKASFINPTAVLMIDDMPTFYAIKHKNPPDFHDSTAWYQLT